MTDGSWDDYVDTSADTGADLGVGLESDLAAIDPTDPSTAVPEVSEVVNDFADQTELSGALSDTDQVTVDSAAYQTDLATDQQSWADWNTGIADENAKSAADSVDYGNQMLAEGETDLAADAFEQADMYAGDAGDAYDTAASNEDTTADYLQNASDSLDTVDYSLDTSMDTSMDTSLDTGMDTGLDTGLDTSMDTGLDTGMDTGFDTGSDY